VIRASKVLRVLLDQVDQAEQEALGKLEHPDQLGLLEILEQQDQAVQPGRRASEDLSGDQDRQELRVLLVLPER